MIFQFYFHPFFYFFNTTSDNNNKKDKEDNDNHYNSENKDKHKISIINSQYKSVSKNNNIRYKDSSNDLEEKDDIPIYKLIRKNEELRRFIHQKKKNKRKNISLLLKNVNNYRYYNNNSFSKSILNLNDKNDNIRNKNNTPAKINHLKINQNVSDTNKHERVLNSLDNKSNQKLNLRLYNINNKNYFQNSILNNNKINNTNNLINDPLFLKDIANTFLLKNLKNKEKLKRYMFSLKINNLEKDLNKNYEDINNKFKNEKISIGKKKKKCKNILEDFDKKINFNLEEFIKDYEKKDLGINFLSFFNYLLMILVNYDKKIIPNTFQIKKEPKEQPDEVKYSTVIKKHNEFMDILNKQFNEGIYANRLLKKCLLNAKEFKKEEEELKK